MWPRVQPENPWTSGLSKIAERPSKISRVATNYSGRTCRSARSPWCPMLKMAVAVVVHLVLLALACTSFTLVTVWASGAWTCSFYTYRYANGWGYVYQSDYTLPVVITYLAAYAVGIAVYGLAWGAGSRYIAATGLALCGVGLVSFGIEGSHWIWSHNLSWIASFPVVMGPLAVVAGCLVARVRLDRRPT
jgi:hypothetical protein